MLPSLFSAVSGLNANQTAMDVVGNNIANVNTVGFKASDVEFESLFNQTLAGATAPRAPIGGLDPQQVGLGVGVAGTFTNFSQGTSESTNQPLDVSIQGGGFLVVKGSGQTLYTRAGDLQLDANGDLVAPDGNYVQGWQAANGVLNTQGPLTNLQIPTGGTTVPGVATTSITLNGNVNLASGSGPTVPVTVYNSAGAASTETLQFTQAANGSWSVAASDGTTGTGGALTYGTPTALTFNSSGQSSSPTVTVTDNAGQPYTLNISNMSANALGATVAAASQNGSAPGTLESYSLGQTGEISGVFSNGQTEVLGQIALASFANEGGLAAVGNTEYAATANSGLAQVGIPGSGPLGTLAPGTLEMSNVDLGQEFTNLIVDQRGFQANSNVVSTSDQVLQSLIQMQQNG